MSFDNFCLHAQISSNIHALDYETPTPIQRAAIPVVMKGRDIIGLAQTGTGKTAAFLLPILNRLLAKPGKGIRVLIVVPTRELADQIREAALDFSEGTKIRSVTLYGGVSINPQIQALRRGCEIVIACPGRLLDHLQQRTIDLRGVDTLVLDEADQMFDMGFLPNIRKIVQHLPKSRQTLLFSATMPAEIRRLTNEVLQNPETIQAGSIAPVATVAHALYPVPQHLKTALLMELLKTISSESVLVFTRTKHRAKRLEEVLQKARFKVASLHGNLSQNRRQASMKGFRSGEFQVLVATDIAARGIDISSVTHVINYDIPDTTEAYTHRIGRTGRAERNGDAFTFVTQEDNEMVRQVEKVLKAPIERRHIEGFDYRAAAPARSESPERGRRPSSHNSRGRGGRPSSSQGNGQRPRSGPPSRGENRGFARGRSR